MVLAFCNSPHGPLSVYQVSLNYPQYFLRYAQDKSVTDECSDKAATTVYAFPLGSVKISVLTLLQILLTLSTHISSISIP